eukprot:TRINITY_DN640_c0_g1_i1.p10 TRINITY_DN640_c0_g1~~TRINITY_DN640_c0_g1_i1.p10  ORF type:complete len:109 (+),score=4.33 TRINITY_DN640_c0_g1_i1:1629-1955(+)
MRGIKYSTAKTIVKIYKKEGRIEKKTDKCHRRNSTTYAQGLICEEVPQILPVALPTIAVDVLKPGQLRSGDNFWGELLARYCLQGAYNLLKYLQYPTNMICLNKIYGK